MKIKIEERADGFFIAKKKFLFWWIKIDNDMCFHYEHNCVNWLKDSYAPFLFKSKKSYFIKQGNTYEFYPEKRDRIDLDFM